jgi:hypothetical protein
MSTPEIFMSGARWRENGLRRAVAGGRARGKARSPTPFMTVQARSATGWRMTRILIAAIAAAALAAPAMAQNDIGTLARGTFACELPGDAAGSVGVPQPSENFTIESASRYGAAGGGGTYLRRGDLVTMTSGPRNGDAYRIVGRDFLRKIEGGEPGRLRCIRQGR